MLFKKEKKVIELIEAHANKVKQCLELTSKALKAFFAGQMHSAKTLARKTDKTESEADLIRHEVRNILYSGAYMPLLREDIYKLVERMDAVANAAEKCCDIFLNQRPPVPASMAQDFMQIAEVSMSIGKALENAMLCYLRGVCPVEESRRLAKEIGMIESKVDKLEWDITKKIFSSHINYSLKLHLRYCLDALVQVSDKAEDAADQMELVTFKSMT
ncbi:MAG: DUF47 domain-containing protein [Desulfobacteraceae bacterium]|nr:DUF47 domain-containing protein [Desulfobacteraceae bacterium]